MTLSLAHTYKIIINKWTWIINIITNVNMKPQVFSFSTWNKIYICFPCSFHCFPIFILAMPVIFKYTCKLIPWADKKQEKLFLFFPFTIYIINLQTMYLLDPFDFWLLHLKSTQDMRRKGREGLKDKMVPSSPYFSSLSLTAVLVST